MIIVLKPEATAEDARLLLDQIGALGLRPLHMPGSERVVLGALGDERILEQLHLDGHPMVESVKPILAPYKLVGRDLQAADTVVTLGDVDVGGERIVVMAGPCAVESADQMRRTALAAVAAGARLTDCWRLVAGVRAIAPALAIGLLVYGNLILRRGVERFYTEAAAAGADSVLVADVPLDEAPPFVAAAHRSALAPVLIAPPNASGGRLRRIAQPSRGDTYVTARAGVTGDDELVHPELAGRLAALREAGAAPPVLGFGVSGPSPVRAARRAGAAGVIVGSAIVRRVATAPAWESAAFRHFLRSLKDATLATGVARADN